MFVTTNPLSDQVDDIDPDSVQFDGPGAPNEVVLGVLSPGLRQWYGFWMEAKKDVLDHGRESDAAWKRTHGDTHADDGKNILQRCLDSMDPKKHPELVALTKKSNRLMYIEEHVKRVLFNMIKLELEIFSAFINEFEFRDGGKVVIPPERKFDTKRLASMIKDSGILPLSFAPRADVEPQEAPAAS